MRILLCKTFQWMSAMRFLSDKDLEWMASYEQGDTILFQSSNGIDTMTIDRALLLIWGIVLLNIPYHQ